MSDKDYVLQIKIKNGPMVRAMRAAGFKNALSLATAARVDPSTLGLYLGLRLSPLLKSGEWRTSIIRIAGCLNALPEDIFPPQHLQTPLAKNVAEVEMSADEVKAIAGWAAPEVTDETPELALIASNASDSLMSLLQTLTAREERVLRNRFGFGVGEKTLEEAGLDLNVTRVRLRQIEIRAINKLKKKIKNNKNEAEFRALLT